MLDPEAKAADRRRLSDLRDEVAEADQLNDLARAGRAQAEIEWLTQQLSAGLGLGGQDRKPGGCGTRSVDRHRVDHGRNPQPIHRAL